MSLIILLDSGPLGLVTNPKASHDAIACKQWLRALPQSGHLALVPEIIDYELRRELRLYKKAQGLQHLDGFKAIDRYLPLTTEAMLKAAEFWATVRQSGLPTADKAALDVDVILAAQAATLNPASWGAAGANVIVATVNVGHLSRFVTAQPWQAIV